MRTMQTAKHRIWCWTACLLAQMVTWSGPIHRRALPAYSQNLDLNCLDSSWTNNMFSLWTVRRFYTAELCWRIPFREPISLAQFVPIYQIFWILEALSKWLSGKCSGQCGLGTISRGFSHQVRQKVFLKELRFLHKTTDMPGANKKSLW